MHCQLGQEVGYSIRFEDLTSAATRIKVLTDGLLLREVLVDPLLSRYSVIMVDEAHERSLSSDVLLGVLKKIRQRRQDLRIVVSSATLDTTRFAKFFSNESVLTTDGEEELDRSLVSIISIEGRAYPVDILYLASACEDYLEAAIDTAFSIHDSEGQGDILIFLTGREEIERALDMIAERLPSLKDDQPSILSLPLYAGLSTEQHMFVFEPAPANTRKVICATNIAEASVTIDGIAFVIDPGFVKLRTYNPTTGIESLATTSISKASAAQRAGRAGRTKPGKCYRLYTEAVYERMDEATVPEIQRSNLAPVVLQLKALGIDNVARFDFLSPPPAELVARALELLFSLGAVDEYAKLTSPLGKRMAEIGLEPMISKCLLSAASFGCLSEMLSITAMISLQGNVWFSHEERKKEETMRRKFAVEEGDHLTLLNVYQAFVDKGSKNAKWCQQHYLNFKSLTRAVSIRTQLQRYLQRFGIDVTESLSSSSNGALRVRGGADPTTKAENIRRCLTSGFFANAAKMQPDGTFRTVDGGTVLHAHPSGLMFNRKAEWVVFGEIVESGNKTFIRDVTKIERAWLVQYAPDFYKLNSR